VLNFVSDPNAKIQRSESARHGGEQRRRDAYSSHNGATARDDWLPVNRLIIDYGDDAAINNGAFAELVATVCQNYKGSGPCRNGSPPSEPAEQPTTLGLAINLSARPRDPTIAAAARGLGPPRLDSLLAAWPLGGFEPAERLLGASKGIATAVPRAGDSRGSESTLSSSANADSVRWTIA
jgi:hypothetical protein